MTSNGLESRMIPRSVLILADIEGVTGVNCKKQCKPNTEAWCDARYLLTADVNAAITGLKRAGVAVIHVKDMHGTGFNIIPERLDNGVNCSQGHYWKPVPLIGKMPEADCAIMIGWHAGPDQQDGFSPHIFHKSIRCLKINGRPVTEVELFSAVLGEYGIPVVFLSADRVAVSRVRENMPWIESVEIPKRNLFPREGVHVRRKIETCVEQSVLIPERWKSLVLGRHVMEMRLPDETVVKESSSAAETLETILARTAFKAYPVLLLPFLLPFYRAWCGFKASKSL